jgi:cyclophilin family peptidyl-prolyl cis-trans isomerase
MASKSYDRAPEMALEPGYEYYANFVTEKGPVKVRLFAEEAPQTVNNFVFLARDGYFDGTTFHRVIADNMVR